ncbi:MAG: hypothetical protein HOW73_30410 [Polyangiaceae bacterium]|nr:hypothetical protein [Polyangiaceae bacterium]
MSILLRAALLTGSLLALAACAPDSGPDDEDFYDDSESDDDALSAGKNGKACTASAYNCKLRVEGGNVVENAQDGLWSASDAMMVDGNGDPMAPCTWDHLRFNYGQTRHMNGVTYGMARSCSNGSSGWFPLSHLASEETFRDRVGEVNAKGTDLEHLGCYKIKSSHDAALVEKKVVYDAKGDHERAGDYLPLVRNNGKRYANLAFNVPGFGLGGPAVDIFPAGTKFQRVDVPTATGNPSIDIPLYVKDSSGRYRKKSGTMKFIYGYVKSKPGHERFGWMAYDALTTTTGCP